MKNLILAAMMGVASLAPMTVPTQAVSLTITTDDGMGRYDDDYYWRRHHMRDEWRYRDRYEMRDDWRYRGRYEMRGGYRYGHNRDCMVRVHKRWHHHHWVVKRVWSCGLHRGWRD
ncbi:MULTISPECIES: hypothetical protein [unclassified Mesorhizobium]|uniref:hypothetical protein n=1 Tax=unclassified Mesorhizobium TaxID=325217 RepID=UPI000FCA8287|nr:MULTISPECIES: hypothetical protein [unclassified Mesorhizobium]RUW33477.1 hypothetical protein EOA38_12895 [Mesorhizobium sp. M1E.F.Ca.ET.041.01.1.1]RWD84055.1 MAG: hypothetical protein EOS38_24370 [Mesorhizobium sp.]RWD89689.1 MAG: hypothetical protein EOS39_20495 [Mesorhizobium sp.]TIV51181.1 MAG: hypothetical protein E5V88_17485 [Mesorhizobium sp.]